MRIVTKPRCKECIYKDMKANEGPCKECGEVQHRLYKFESKFQPKGEAANE